MAPGVLKPPTPLPPVVMYKRTPAPRSMAPGYLDDNGTHLKFLNRPNIRPIHYETHVSHGLSEEQETDRTSKISAQSTPVKFASVSGSPTLTPFKEALLSPGSRTPKEQYGGDPGYTSTGVPDRKTIFGSSVGASSSVPRIRAPPPAVPLVNTKRQMDRKAQRDVSTFMDKLGNPNRPSYSTRAAKDPA